MLRIFKKKNQKNEKAQVKENTLATVAETLERYGEAAGVAQAGEPEMARELIQQHLQEHRKILVVGREDSFSRPLVDYAVGFAKRMQYEIVALNCIPFGHEAPKVLNPYQEELRDKFECSAKDGAEFLICRAKEEGVPVQHVVKFGAVDQCISNVHDEFRRMEFVLTEPEPNKHEGQESSIPVFCLAK